MPLISSIIPNEFQEGDQAVLEEKFKEEEAYLNKSNIKPNNIIRNPNHYPGEEHKLKDNKEDLDEVSILNASNPFHLDDINVKMNDMGRRLITPAIVNEAHQRARAFYQLLPHMLLTTKARYKSNKLESYKESYQNSFKEVLTKQLKALHKAINDTLQNTSGYSDEKIQQLALMYTVMLKNIEENVIKLSKIKTKNGGLKGFFKDDSRQGKDFFNNLRLLQQALVFAASVNIELDPNKKIEGIAPKQVTKKLFESIVSQRSETFMNDLSKAWKKHKQCFEQKNKNQRGLIFKEHVKKQITKFVKTESAKDKEICRQALKAIRKKLLEAMPKETKAGGFRGAFGIKNLFSKNKLNLHGNEVIKFLDKEIEKLDNELSKKLSNFSNHQNNSFFEPAPKHNNNNNDQNQNNKDFQEHVNALPSFNNGNNVVEK